jgi:hypothetical protein
MLYNRMDILITNIVTARCLQSEYISLHCNLNVHTTELSRDLEVTYHFHIPWLFDIYRYNVLGEEKKS